MSRNHDEPADFLTELDRILLPEVTELRTQAAVRFKPGEIQEAIGKYLRSLPPVERDGHRYSPPYSIAREVAALRKLLGIERPRSTREDIW